MTEQKQQSGVSETAFRAMDIGPLPESPKERMRIVEELQPFGSDGGIIPYLGTIQDVESLQEHEQTDPEFRSKDWWWDHQGILFLNEKLGLKFLLLIIPLAWVLFLWLSGLAAVAWVMTEILEQRNLSEGAVWLVMILGFLLGIGWLGFAIWATPITTNWLMSTGMGFVLKPFEKAINKRLDQTLEDGCSEFNRVTGHVRLAMGGGRFFQAPFVEFDAYVDRMAAPGTTNTTPSAAVSPKPTA